MFSEKHNARNRAETESHEPLALTAQKDVSGTRRPELVDRTAQDLNANINNNIASLGDSPRSFPRRPDFVRWLEFGFPEIRGGSGRFTDEKNSETAKTRKNGEGNEMVTIKEAAKILRIDPRSVRRIIANHRDDIAVEKRLIKETLEVEVEVEKVFVSLRDLIKSRQK